MGRQDIELSEVMDVIGLMYDTALSGRDWTDVLKSIATRLDLRSAMLRMVDYTNRDVGFFDTFDYSSGLTGAYREDFIDIDPYRRIFETMPVGAMGTADDYLGRKNRRQGVFYNEYERPNGAEYILGALLARNETVQIQAGFHRTRQAGDFEPETLRFFELMLPHLMRAVKMRQMLASPHRQQVLYESALDRLSVGVMLVDAQSRPLFVNEMAERLMAASNGALRISRGILQAKDIGDNARLCGMIVDASLTTMGCKAATGGDMRLTSNEGSVLQLCVIPLSRQRLGSEFAAPSACAAVFISRHGGMYIPWRRIALCYRLTPAEAKLAAQLVNGESLEEIAARLGISLHTARSQLKSVFAKTGARRQSELVAMLLQGVLAISQNNEEEI